uniref:ATP synthase complex subunit 8 n=1 Tax=Synchiropus sycorax TaxID=2723631 RepID=A0A6H0DN80_9TELE|nr:ATP synthase F0 subunit 8 [Synchiropus sycorax]QIS89400.1 ATP synthase F0 subunit 8 [Synchiropus sycorax]
MPQLNPSPWLMILLLSWTIFLFFIPTKVITHIFPNKLIPGAKNTFTKTPWTWPW